MKIGIFAGTFDPIHEGHIRFAQAAVQQGHLDKVIIVAEKNPYRKEPIASWDHRQAMIERATEQLPEADHDYNFSNQLAHQHTMQNMLVTARRHYGSEHEYWFLVGSDIFEHMKRWHDVVAQQEYGGFVVMLRDDHNEQWLHERLNELQERGNQVKVELIINHHPHISSRKVRDQVANEQTPTNLPSTVHHYIVGHNLYGKS